MLGVEDMAVTPSQAPSPAPGQELGRFEGEHSVTGSPQRAVDPLRGAQLICRCDMKPGLLGS